MILTLSPDEVRAAIKNYALVRTQDDNVRQGYEPKFKAKDIRFYADSRTGGRTRVTAEIVFSDEQPR